MADRLREELAAFTDARRAIDEQEIACVAAARATGMSWQDIAKIAGVSKSLAIYRWHPDRTAAHRKHERVRY